jgi:hypothetical protein
MNNEQRSRVRRRHRPGHGHGNRHRPSGWGSGARRRSPLSRDPRLIASILQHVSVSGGPAPVRAYIEEQLPDVLATDVVSERGAEAIELPKGRLKGEVA